MRERTSSRVSARRMIEQLKMSPGDAGRYPDGTNGAIVYDDPSLPAIVGSGRRMNRRAIASSHIRQVLEGLLMTNDNAARERAKRNVYDTPQQVFVYCLECGETVEAGELFRGPCEACCHNRDAIETLKRLEQEARFGSRAIAAERERREVAFNLSALFLTVFAAIWYWGGFGYACAWLGLILAVRLVRTGLEARRRGIHPPRPVAPAPPRPRPTPPA